MSNSDGRYLFVWQQLIQKQLIQKAACGRTHNLSISEYQKLGCPPSPLGQKNQKNNILLHSKGSIIGINGCVAQLLNSCIALLQKIVLPWDFAYLGCWVKATTMQKIGSVQTSSLQWVKIHMLEESLMFEIIYACVKYKKKVKIKLFVKICLMCVNILPILHVYSKIIRSIKIYLTQPPAPSCQQKKKYWPSLPP